MKIIILLLLLVPVNGYADNWYAAVGFAYHDDVSARPEVNLDREVGTFEFGFEFNFNKHWEVNAYLAHYSGLFTTEHGIGFNPIGAKLKYNF